MTSRPNRSLVPEDTITAELAQLALWTRVSNQIRKTYAFQDFVHAMSFVNSVALLAERLNHHPDIEIRWNSVTLTLSTHSAGGLTALDFELARAIDAL